MTLSYSKTIILTLELSPDTLALNRISYDIIIYLIIDLDIAILSLE
jgi:hypothetical protein